MKKKKFLKFILDNLDNVEIIKDFIILKPTGHIVAGFLLDRSSEKGAYYLYRIIVPLFSPVMPNLSLNYSERLSLDGTTPIIVRPDEEAYECHAAVLEKLRYECSSVLKIIASPIGFSAYCEGKGYERINMKLEVAIAYCLCGNIAKGRCLLDAIIDSKVPDHPYFQGVRDHACNVLNALEAGTEELNNLVKSYENKNTAALFPGITRAVKHE